MAYKGIDVSSYQGNIDWSKVKWAGVQFAILKIIRKNLNPDKTLSKTGKAVLMQECRYKVFITTHTPQQ